LDTPILERVLNTYSKERKTRLLLPYGGVELFYKEDEQSLFPICKKSARFEDGWRYCSKCQDLFINHIVCLFYLNVKIVVPRNRPALGERVV
jgi:hypothetical protein